MIPGLPIIHFNPRGVLVQSPPSRATLRQKDSQEEERRVKGATMLQGIEDGDNVLGASQPAAEASSSPANTGSGAGVSRRNRIKAPNPLSVRKKKKVSKEQHDTVGRKRKADPLDEAQGTSEQVLRTKKKRKRKAKGDVALAIGDLKAGRLEET